jgi:hypothetical protein
MTIKAQIPQQGDESNAAAVTPNVAAVTQIEIFVGDSLLDLQWQVLTLAQLQFRNLLEFVEPGRAITVKVGVIT